MKGISVIKESTHNLFSSGLRFMASTVEKFIPHIDNRILRKEARKFVEEFKGEHSYPSFNPLIALSVSAALEHLMGAHTGLIGDVLSEMSDSYFLRIGGLLVASGLIVGDLWNRPEELIAAGKAFIEYLNPKFVARAD